MHSNRCSIRYGRLPSAALHSTRIGESEENALCFLAILRGCPFPRGVSARIGGYVHRPSDSCRTHRGKHRRCQVVPVSKLFRLCGDTVNGKLFAAFRRKQHPHPSGVSSVLHHVHAGFIRCAAAEYLSHPAPPDPGICGASSVWRNTAVYLYKDVSVRVGIPCDPACGNAPDPVIEQARVAAESSHGIRSHHGLGVPCHKYCAATFCI